MRFEVSNTRISGVKVLLRKPISDERGFFERVFCADDLESIDFKIHQINRSYTKAKGSLRGLHYQKPPFCEAKIISCLRGSVFDVALDLREGSPSYLQWHSEVLSAENHKSFLLPKGVAHGFQTLENDCELIYLHDTPYTADAEGQVNVYDPKVNISWPANASFLSERDKAAPLLTEDFSGIRV